MTRYYLRAERTLTVGFGGVGFGGAGAVCPQDRVPCELYRARLKYFTRETWLIFSLDSVREI